MKTLLNHLLCFVWSHDMKRLRYSSMVAQCKRCGHQSFWVVH